MEGRKTFVALFAAVAVTFGTGVLVAARGSAEPSHDHATHDHGAHDHGHDHSPVAAGQNDPFGIVATGDEGPLPERDPCSLVAADEAAAVLGELARVEEAGTGVVDGQRVCTYALAANPNLSVAIAITDTDAARKLEVLQTYHAAEASALSDLGDAFWVGPFKLLVARSGDWLLSVHVLVPTEHPEMARIKALQLARTALARLS